MLLLVPFALTSAVATSWEGLFVSGVCANMLIDVACMWRLGCILRCKSWRCCPLFVMLPPVQEKYEKITAAQELSKTQAQPEGCKLGLRKANNSVVR